MTATEEETKIEQSNAKTEVVETPKVEETKKVEKTEVVEATEEKTEPVKEEETVEESKVDFSKFTKDELQKKLKEIRSEVAELRKQTKELNEKKEKSFNSCTKISKKIAELVGNIRNNKDSRDDDTGNVHDTKRQRDEFNKQVKQKITEVKKLHAKKKKLMDKYGIKGNPMGVQQQIEKLEFQIETEPMNFNKEQALMKEIKELKKNLVNSKELNELFKEIKKYSDEIEDLKNKANELHKSLQSKASMSQEQHQAIIDHRTKIKTYKKQRKEAFDIFKKYKKEFKELNKKLKSKTKELIEINKVLGIEYKKKEEKKKNNTKQKLKDLRKEVEKKLIKGEKLTNDDLMILQS